MHGGGGGGDKILEHSQVMMRAYSIKWKRPRLDLTELVNTIGLRNE